MRGKTNMAYKIDDLIDRMDNLISAIEIQTAVMDHLIDAIMKDGEEEEEIVPATLDLADEDHRFCLGNH